MSAITESGRTERLSARAQDSDAQFTIVQASQKADAPAHAPPNANVVPVPHWIEYFKALAGSGGALFLGIAGVLFSIHSSNVQERHLEESFRAEQAKFKLQQDEAARKLYTDLMPKITCVANTQREIALDLLRAQAPQMWRLALAAIEKCPTVTPQAARRLSTLKRQAADSEAEAAFVLLVANGRQYRFNALPGAAARTFDAAADAIPGTYIVNHVLDLDQVAAARRAYSDSRFSEAADLFALAYRKVPDPGSPSSAFRGNPVNYTSSPEK